MKIEKRGSGSYRIRKMYRGKMYTVTFDHKPTQKEAMLACYGMRRSEICALQADDIDGDIVHITKAMVQNEDKEWVIKKTKTTESTRDIIIPEELADMICKQGYVYKGHPNSISDYLIRTEKRLGIPRFSIQ